MKWSLMSPNPVRKSLSWPQCSWGIPRCSQALEYITVVLEELLCGPCSIFANTFWIQISAQAPWLQIHDSRTDCSEVPGVPIYKRTQSRHPQRKRSVQHQIKGRESDERRRTTETQPTLMMFRGNSPREREIYWFSLKNKWSKIKLWFLWGHNGDGWLLGDKEKTFTEVPVTVRVT